MKPVVSTEVNPTVATCRFVLRWLARVTSLISVGLLMLFMFGGGEDATTMTGRQWVGLIFFPFGVSLGLVLAWWREALGAIVAVSSLTCFYLVYGLLLSERFPGGPWFMVFTSPAVLFFASWLLEKSWTYTARSSSPGR